MTQAGKSWDMPLWWSGEGTGCGGAQGDQEPFFSGAPNTQVRRPQELLGLRGAGPQAREPLQEEQCPKGRPHPWQWGPVGTGHPTWDREEHLGCSFCYG